MASAIDILLNLLIPLLFPRPNKSGTIFYLIELDDPELLMMLSFFAFSLDLMLAIDNFCEHVDEAKDVLDLRIDKFIYFSKSMNESTSF